MLKCSVCQEMKPVGAFTPRPNRPRGAYSKCKACKAAFRSRRYCERRVHDPVQQWAVLARNWAKTRATKAQIPFTITWDDIHEMAKGGRCLYCGKTLNFQVTRGNLKERVDSPSLDRVLPEQGYTCDNTVLCCHRCNAIKSDASAAELRRISEAVEGIIHCRGLLHA